MNRSVNKADVANIIRAAAFALIFSLVYANSALADHGFKGDSEAGRTVYQQTCIACHGADGRGAIERMPDLRGQTGPLSQSDHVLLERIIDGYESGNAPFAMPPLGGNSDLEETDVINVLSYMKQKFAD